MLAPAGLACAVLCADGAARAHPERTLGPSDRWSTGQDDEPLVRGLAWDDAAAVTMPPPHLEATVTAGGVVSWSLTLRVTASRAAQGTFTLGAGGAAVAVDGAARGPVTSRSLVVALTAGDHVVVLYGIAETRELHHLTGSEHLDPAPLEVRHLLLANRSTVHHATLAVVLPTSAIAPTGPTRMSGTATVRVPVGWFGTDTSDHSTFPCVARGYTESTYRCEVTTVGADVHGIVEASAGTTSKEVRLAVTVRSPLHRPFVIPGGPIVGFGSQLGEGFRMRLGYELGIASRRAFVSSSVDTDYHRNAVAAVALKGAWGFGILGAGIGVPVQVAPRVATGARLEGDLFLGPVGFVASADLWVFSPDGFRVTGTLMGVLSF